MSLDRRPILVRLAAAVMLLLALAALGSRLLRPYRLLDHPNTTHLKR